VLGDVDVHHFIVFEIEVLVALRPVHPGKAVALRGLIGPLRFAHVEVFLHIRGNIHAIVARLIGALVFVGRTDDHGLAERGEPDRIVFAARIKIFVDLFHAFARFIVGIKDDLRHVPPLVGKFQNGIQNRVRRAAQLHVFGIGRVGNKARMLVLGIIILVGGVEKDKIDASHREKFHMARDDPVVRGVVITVERLIGPMHVIGGAFHAVGITLLRVYGIRDFLPQTIGCVEHGRRPFRRLLQFCHVVHARRRQVRAQPKEVEYPHIPFMVGLFLMHGRDLPSHAVCRGKTRFRERIFVHSAPYISHRIPSASAHTGGAHA